MAAPILAQKVQLSQMLERGLPEDATIELLVVELQTMVLSGRLQPKQVMVRMKYGRPGASTSCDTPTIGLPPRTVERTPKGFQPFDDSFYVDCRTRCYMLWRKWQGSDIRIRLQSGSGMFASTIARASLDIQGSPGCTDVLLHHSTGVCVGKIAMAAERVSMTKRQLRQVLARCGARLQAEALVVHAPILNPTLLAKTSTSSSSRRGRSKDCDIVYESRHEEE